MSKCISNPSSWMKVHLYISL